MKRIKCTWCGRRSDKAYIEAQRMADQIYRCQHCDRAIGEIITRALKPPKRRRDFVTPVLLPFIAVYILAMAVCSPFKAAFAMLPGRRSFEVRIVREGD